MKLYSQRDIECDVLEFLETLAEQDQPIHFYSYSNRDGNWFITSRKEIDDDNLSDKFDDLIKEYNDEWNGDDEDDLEDYDD